MKKFFVFSILICLFYSISASAFENKVYEQVYIPCQIIDKTEIKGYPTFRTTLYLNSDSSYYCYTCFDFHQRIKSIYDSTYNTKSPSGRPMFMQTLSLYSLGTYNYEKDKLILHCRDGASRHELTFKSNDTLIFSKSMIFMQGMTLVNNKDSLAGDCHFLEEMPITDEQVFSEDGCLSFSFVNGYFQDFESSLIYENQNPDSSLNIIYEGQFPYHFDDRYLLKTKLEISAGKYSLSVINDRYQLSSGTVYTKDEFIYLIDENTNYEIKLKRSPGKYIDFIQSVPIRASWDVRFFLTLRGQRMVAVKPKNKN